MENQGTKSQAETGMLTGLFNDKDSSESAYRSLRDRGYSDEEINVVMSDDTRKKYYANDVDSELGSKAAEGTGVGGAIGGTIGAIIGGVAAIGTNLVLPGVGLVVWGPLAAALAGAGAGGLTGGLVGALIGWGIPEDRAKLYETGIQEGGTVLGVTPRSPEDAQYFENDWKTNHRGQHIYR
jgi:ABC-type branched-chain amino acid transport system, permease component